MDKMRIGAQMYTVHDHAKDLDGFADSLRRIADIGYEFVQVSGTCAYEPEWLAEQLKATGLKCTLTHTNADRIAAETDAVIAEHTVFDCDYIGIGGYFLHQYGVDSFVEKYKDAAKKISAAGKKFTYHNHDWEFNKLDGKSFLAHLAETFPAEDLAFTVDTYWIQAGGGDPAWWIKNFSGRVPCIHLKDMGYGKRMEWIGNGNLNFEAIFREAEAAGTKYMFVEQDDCNGEEPFECLRKSYEYLKANGFN